ncbi:MAG: glycosyltransferase family 39 protein [Pseudomonadota bacterium]|nr:glycosyltransferase family 39 protein [Pseudomonadota bacterium]
MAISARLYGLDDIPLWTDELFTRFYPESGLAYLWGPGLRTEPTSPLYYTLIWLIEHVGGTSALLLRTPSVLASLLGIWLAWRLARELFDHPAPALLAALLLALAPVDVLFAEEARAYALQAAALGLTLLAFARILRGASGLTLYVAGATLAIWFHPTSIAAVAALNAAALFSTIGAGRLLSPRAWLRFLAANVLVALACTPLIPGMLAPAGGDATSWIPALTRWSLESVIGQTLAGPATEPNTQRIAELGTLALVALALLPPWRPGRRAATVLVLVPGLALAIMIVISLGRPVLLTRTLAWFLIPLAVALGSMIVRRPAPIAIPLASAVAALTAAALFVQIRQGAALKEGWPALFAQMPDLAAPALLVLAPHSPPGAVALYAPASAKPVRLDDGGPPSPETVVMPRLFGTPTLSRAQFAAAIAAGTPVWLVYRRPEYGWVKTETSTLPAPKHVIQSETGPNPALRAMQW